jgi:hypothetical protein
MKYFSKFSKVSIIVCLVWAVINISSAYAEHCFKRVDMLPLSPSYFKISSMTMLTGLLTVGHLVLVPSIFQTFLYNFSLL